MKQLTKLPGPSMSVWVIWRHKASVDALWTGMYWSAVGFYSERHDAERNAQDGDRVLRYSVEEFFTARRTGCYLVRDAG